mmetsp:Transcript_17793/g.43920  ORF Transcript_17793/g.43920 Transcript_17793/m.43920 type:complete len:259 (-) Transcript_17793:1073-1849(-)
MGILPEISFRETSKCCKSIMLDMATGISPVNLLSCNAKNTMRLLSPIVGGKGPERSLPCKSKISKLFILVKRSDGKLPLMSLREKSISFMAVQLANIWFVKEPAMRLSSMYKYCILMRAPKSPMFPVKPLSSSAKICKLVCCRRLGGMNPVSKLLDNPSRRNGNLVPNQSGKIPVMAQYCNSKLHSLVRYCNSCGSSPSRPGLNSTCICSRELLKYCNSEGMVPSNKLDGISSNPMAGVAAPSGVSQMTPSLVICPLR